MTTGEWLRQARIDSKLSLIDIVIRLREELPRPLWVSVESVRRVEAKADPDPVLVAALARIYGKAPDDWPLPLREAVEKVQHVLDATRLLLKGAA